MAGEKSAFSEAERAAMKERAREQRDFKKLSGEEQVSLKIAEMTKEEQKLALALHSLVLRVSPKLKPKTWYGMPAYYLGDKVICFFQAASKFQSRYSTFGFQEDAKLDDGSLWPTSFAITELTRETSDHLSKLVEKAVRE